MTATDWVGASPHIGLTNKDTLRAALTKRAAYCLADTDTLQTITVVDAFDGSLPLYVTQVGRLFQFDSTDTTTAHDGATCLVSLDGRRYKTVDFATPWAVLDKDLTAPPGSPSVGDAYRVASAATGLWASHDLQIAVFTQRGWNFVTVPIGKSIYVRDEDSYYHRNAAGTWVQGLATFALASNSVEAISLVGQPVRWFIVNQTTNTPPGSPAVGVTYIIGGVPTGAWAGNAAAIAQWNGSIWRIYAPRAGELAYDIAQGNDYRFSGSAWIATNTTTMTGTAVTATGGQGPFTRSNSGSEDATTLSYTAKASAKKIRFTYRARIAQNTGGSISFNEHNIGLFRDAETTSIDGTTWGTYNPGGTRNTTIEVSFEITSVDTSAHTYTVKVFDSSGVTLALTASGRLRATEFA